MARRSKAERRLIEFVREEFGGHLGNLLLSGYDVTERVQLRRLVVTVANPTGLKEERFLEIFTEGVNVLPYGHDIVVLAAHLRMLNEQGAVNRLLYDLPDMLKRLGWVDPVEGLRNIEGALIRYYRLSFAEAKRRRHPLTVKAEGRISECRIIDGYDLENEPVRRGIGYPLLYFNVDFNTHFLDRLLRRTLFGIDWNRVTSVSVR